METNEWRKIMREKFGQSDSIENWIEKTFIPISELKRWVEENEKEISNSIDKEEDRYWRRNRNNDLGHNSALKALKDRFIKE